MESDEEDYQNPSDQEDNPAITWWKKMPEQADLNKAFNLLIAEAMGNLVRLIPSEKLVQEQTTLWKEFTEFKKINSLSTKLGAKKADFYCSVMEFIDKKDGRGYFEQLVKEIENLKTIKAQVKDKVSRMDDYLK
jgi:hypothetical protein